MRTSRRRFLILAGCGFAAGGLGYGYHRGIRFPPPVLTSAGPDTRGHAGGIEVSARGAIFHGADDGVFRFRAFVPEPAFEVRGAAGGEARVVVQNIHVGALIQPGDKDAAPRRIDETRRNLERTVSVALPPSGSGEFSWRFPGSDRYRFAAIGDTGGGTELRWVLKRAVELGAEFLIHLGDFYYEDGDPDRAGVNLNAADIPTYAAIGNHDFHDGWRIMYPDFHRRVGPNNAVFRLGGIEFVNFDTAADFIPAERGRRADILNRLQPLDADGGARDRVAFTHMPLRDPKPERSHAVGRAAEARWIRDRLLASGTRNLLVGHLHIKQEFDDQGLYTWITGQGLAHADLLVGRPYAEILLGDVEPGEPVRYQWQPLDMPFEAHCNLRGLGVLDALEKPEVKARLLKQCGKA